MSEVNLEMAKSVYDSVCAVIEEMGLKMNKHDEDLVVTFGHRGDDMDHDLLIAINAKRETILVMERLPFDINPEKSADVASAVCLVNSRLVLGGFTYDLKDRLSYEVSQVYAGSLIGKDAIKRMIFSLVFTVEDYDDKFMALNKGYLKVSDIEEN